MLITVGATSNQKMTRETLADRVRMLKSAPHWLH